jgi:flagellar motor switch protein FliM
MPAAKPRQREMTETSEHGNGRRLLAADMFRRKRAPSFAASSDAVRLSRKLAEASESALADISSAPWRILADHIGEEAMTASEGFGSWVRFESSAGSMTVNLSFDMPAIAALCECAMGGTGTEAHFEFQERPLSAIEKDIAHSAIARLSKSIAASLTEQLGMAVSLFDGTIASDEAAGADAMLLLRFIANVFGYSGEIRMAVPKDELAVQLAAAGRDESPASDADDRKAMLQAEIGKADAQFVISLQSETMRVEEIGALAPGCLVRLASTAATPVLVSSGDTPVYLAALARNGDRLAVRVSTPAA